MAATPPATRESRWPGFRGWWVIAGLFFMLMTSAGFGFYGVSVYLRVLHEQRGFSISAMSFATGVFFLVAGFASIVIGRLLQRIDPRPIVVAGAAIGSLSILGIGRANEIWQVYLLYATFGAGFACVSLTTSTTLVARWFNAQRAVALSIASTGLSTGGIVLTPRAKSLLLDYGLATGTNWIAALFFIMLVTVPMVLLSPDPQRLGLAPDGVRAAPGTPVALSGTSLAEAKRTNFFKMITLIFALGLLAQVGAIAQLFSVVSERTNKGTAGLAVSTLAFAGVAGRLLGGFVLTRAGSKRFALGALGLQATGSVIVATGNTRVALLGGAVIFGLGMGNVLLLHPLLLAERFGVKEYGRIYSLSQAGTNIGVASGPVLLGVLRDRSGGYVTSYLVAASLAVIAGLLLWRSIPAAPGASSD